MSEQETCHVCKRPKKPYVVFLNNDITSMLKYQEARENGPICQRCDSYHGMTGEFKDATDQEFRKAVASVRFARAVLEWWTKDEKLDPDKTDFYNSRQWPGTEELAKWHRTRKT